MTVEDIIQSGWDYENALNSLDVNVWLLYEAIFSAILIIFIFLLFVCLTFPKRTKRSRTAIVLSPPIFVTSLILGWFALSRIENRHNHAKMAITEGMQSSCLQFKRSITQGDITTLSFGQTYSVFKWCGEQAIRDAANSAESKMQFHPSTRTIRAAKTGAIIHLPGWVAEPK